MTETDALALRQSSCGHVFIANGADPICVHCGISESVANKPIETAPQAKPAVVQVQYHYSKYSYEAAFGLPWLNINQSPASTKS